MTQTELRDRALSALPGGRARFDPLTLLILGAVVSSIIGHYIERSLAKCETRAIRNPGFLARWQLRRAIRAAWSHPAVAHAAVVSSVDASALDRMYGDDVQRALLATVAGLSDSEIDSLKAA